MTNRAHGHAKVLARDLRACERNATFERRARRARREILREFPLRGLRGLCVERDLFTISQFFFRDLGGRASSPATNVQPPAADTSNGKPVLDFASARTTSPRVRRGL